MLHILGVGASTGQHIVTNEFLNVTDGDPWIVRAGVCERRTSLSIEQLKAGNTDILAARKGSVATPTTLAVAAVRQALDRAGISAEQVGLILADCSTPYETCPSEAQRIGGALGLKVAAYDLSVGIAALPVYLETLNSWQSDRLPDYVLCVSTNTPTQHIRYDVSSPAASICGDAAGAFVISPRIAGALTVEHSHLQKVRGQGSSISIGRTVEVHDQMLPLTELVQLSKAMINRLEQQAGLDRSRAWVVGPQLYAGDFSRSAAELSLSSEQIVSGVATTGFSLGASPIVAIEQRWDSLTAGEQIAIIHAGDGYWSGSLMLGRR